MHLFPYECLGVLVKEIIHHRFTQNSELKFVNITLISQNSFI